MADLRITVEEDSALGDDGYAVFRVLGQAQHRDGPLRILVSRDGANGCLGPRGWGPRCYGFRPRQVSGSGSDLLLQVGPEIVNPVEEFTLVKLRIPPLSGEAMVRWPALKPTADIPRIEIEPDAWEADRFGEPHPAEPVAIPREPQTQAAPVPEAEAPAVTAAPSQAGEPCFTFGDGQAAGTASVDEAATGLEDAAATQRRGVRLWLALLLMMLILLIGLGYHFADRWMERDEPVAQETLPAAEHEAEAEVPAVEEEPEAPAEEAPEAADTEPEAGATEEPAAPLTAGQRLEEAQAALLRGDNETAIRLLRENERDGHGASMTELAQHYDSIGFEAGLFAAPNDSEAVRLYGAACAVGDEGAAVLLAALRDHLMDLADRGDVAAQTIVGDAGRLPSALAACGL